MKIDKANNSINDRPQTTDIPDIKPSVEKSRSPSLSAQSVFKKVAPLNLN